jgi:hypothetical protein
MMVHQLEFIKENVGPQSQPVKNDPLKNHD